jgi:hypothetical protein
MVFYDTFAAVQVELLGLLRLLGKSCLMADG